MARVRRTGPDCWRKPFGAIRLDDATVTEDDKAFAAVAARQYYQICHDEIRRLDPNHLIFGDRYASIDLPELKDILKAAAPFIDGVAIQPFE